MYVHYESPIPYVQVTQAAPSVRSLVIRHHALLLARLAWRPALALLAAAGVTLTRAMAPNPISDGKALILSAAAAGLFVTGGLAGAWTYLNWSCSALVVGSGRLIVRGGVPGIRRYHRELLLTRVSRVDLRWPVLAPRAWRCADLAIGIAGASEIRFPLAADAGVARDALLNLPCSRASFGDGPYPVTVATGPAVTIARVVSPEAVRTYNEGPALRAVPPDGSSRPNIAPEAARVWRRHVWWPLRRSLWPVALGLVGFAIPLLVWPAEVGLAAGDARLAGVALIAVAALWLAMVWLLWWHDRLLVHDGRLVYRSGTRWSGGARDSTIALAAADDFALRIGSPLAHLLGYGDVAVGMNGAWQFVYRCASQPEALLWQLREASVVAQVGLQTAAGSLLDGDVVLAPALTARERSLAGRNRRLVWPRSFVHRRARDRA